MSEEKEISKDAVDDAASSEVEAQATASDEAESEEQRKQRVLASLQHQVAILLDELKKLFAPNMRLTFIARSIDDASCYSFLSEETSNEDLIKLLQNMKKPTPIERPSLDVIN